MHLLCNNAGVFSGGLLWERTVRDFEWVFAVNLYGIVHAIRSFVPRMLAQDAESHIVNTASMGGLVTNAYSGPYYTSKFAAVGLTECLAHDLAASGAKIGVSLLVPSLIATSIGTSERNRQERYVERGNPEPTPDAAFVTQMLQDSTAGGMPPSEVAALVIDAVQQRTASTSPRSRATTTRSRSGTRTCRSSACPAPPRSTPSVLARFALGGRCSRWQAVARAAFPVGVAELALVELAVGVAWHLGGVVDGARVLLLRDVVAAVVHDRLRGRVVRGPALAELDDGLDLLAGVLVGDAEHGDVGDRGVLDERALDLGRVDVDAADDDHVVRAVVEEQVARRRRSSRRRRPSRSRCPSGGSSRSCPRP